MSGAITPEAVRKVVIVGRDAAAWLTALGLQRALGPAGVSVEVVELPGLLRPCDIYASLPALHGLHERLGLDEYDLLKATSGTYSLGQSFANFSRAAPPFFHPYGSHGAAINRVPFLQYWLKARAAGLKVGFEDFSLTAAAAKQNRFFTPTANTASFGRFDYGYHLSAPAYVGFLRRQGARRGIPVTPSRRIAVQRDATGGHMTAVIADGGRTVEGDLFIDATGAESLLLGGALQVPFESWAQWFPDNRILSVSAEKLRSLPPFSQVRGLSESWMTLTPLQDATAIQHIYDGEHMKDEQALETAAVVAGLRLRDDAVVSPFGAGRRATFWADNCIAVGEAACVLSPIDNVGLHAIHTGLAHVISLFPVDRQFALDAAEFNRCMAASLERLRDFQIAHFKLNQNYDQPFWDHMRQVEAPPELDYKIELFKARGQVALYDDETFQLDDWLAIFLGHGLMPRSHDPLVDRLADADTIAHFQGMLGFIKTQIEEMSSHDAYVELYAAKDFA